MYVKSRAISSIKYCITVLNLPEMNFTNVRLNFINSVVNNVAFFPSAFKEGCIDLERKSIPDLVIELKI